MTQPTVSDNQVSNWLTDLKAGDEVAFTTYSTTRLAVVQRVTPTQIKIEHRTFRRSDGREVSGDRWGRGSLVELTPALRHKLAFREAADFHQHRANWAGLPPEFVLRVHVELLALVKELEAAQLAKAEGR